MGGETSRQMQLWAERRGGLEGEGLSFMRRLLLHAKHQCMHGHGGSRSEPLSAPLFAHRCQGCFNITTVFSCSQSVVLCGSCSAVLCTPTGGKARLTEGEQGLLVRMEGARGLNHQLTGMYVEGHEWREKHCHREGFWTEAGSASSVFSFFC
jgi:ribosomal protein S27E